MLHMEKGTPQVLVNPKKKQRRNPLKLSTSGKLSIFILYTFLTFRGKELAEHFEKSKHNLELPKKDQLKYIPWPVYVYWNVPKKPFAWRDVRRMENPVDFINSLWNEAILEHLCESTAKISFNRITKKITHTDVRKFLSLELIRGIIGVRDVKLMWKTEGITIGYPSKGKQMPKNQWFQISNGINFDPQFVHKTLKERFQYHVTPGYNVTVDEIRIPCTHEPFVFFLSFFSNTYYI